MEIDGLTEEFDQLSTPLMHLNYTGKDYMTFVCGWGVCKEVLYSKTSSDKEYAYFDIGETHRAISINETSTCSSCKIAGIDVKIITDCELKCVDIPTYDELEELFIEDFCHHKSRIEDGYMTCKDEDKSMDIIDLLEDIYPDRSNDELWEIFSDNIVISRKYDVENEMCNDIKELHIEYTDEDWMFHKYNTYLFYELWFVHEI